jgi:hypothetical protein
MVKNDPESPKLSMFWIVNDPVIVGVDTILTEPEITKSVCWLPDKVSTDDAVSYCKFEYTCFNLSLAIFMQIYQLQVLNQIDQN